MRRSGCRGTTIEGLALVGKLLSRGQANMGTMTDDEVKIDAIHQISLLYARVGRDHEAGVQIHPPSLHQQMHDLAALTTDSEARGLLMELHRFVLLVAKKEGKLESESWASFEKSWDQDYALLLGSECLIGADISPTKLYAVTRREIAAGRMHESDPLGKLAADQVTAGHLSDGDLEARNGLPSTTSETAGPIRTKPRKNSIMTWFRGN